MRTYLFLLITLLLLFASLIAQAQLQIGPSLGVSFYVESVLPQTDIGPYAISGAGYDVNLNRESEAAPSLGITALYSTTKRINYIVGLSYSPFYTSLSISSPNTNGGTVTFDKTVLTMGYHVFHSTGGMYFLINPEGRSSFKSVITGKLGGLWIQQNAEESFTKSGDPGLTDVGRAIQRGRVKSFIPTLELGYGLRWRKFFLQSTFSIVGNGQRLQRTFEFDSQSYTLGQGLGYIRVDLTYFISYSKKGSS